MGKDPESSRPQNPLEPVTFLESLYRMKLPKKIERWVNKRLLSEHLEWHPLVGDYIRLSSGELLEIEATDDVDSLTTGSKDLLVEFSINGEICCWAARTLRIAEQLSNGIRLWHKLVIAEDILRAAGMSPGSVTNRAARMNLSHSS